MHDFSWKFFTHTGNIETYLLIKELEADKDDDGWKEEEIEGPSTVSEQEL